MPHHDPHHRSSSSMKTQRTQYPLIKGYALNHNIRLGPGRSGQRFLFGFLYSPPLNPLHPAKPQSWGGGGVPLCEPINEPQGRAVKFRLLQWIWAVCGRGAPLPLPPPAAHYLFIYIYMYICVCVCIYIYRVMYSLSMHKPYHSSPRRRCTPTSCESKSPRPAIMSSSQHTAGPRRTTRSV